MAAGATIGSNHNSRANDGEIEAGRGFWPGLSTSVKHSSRFASYCLLARGDYRFELDIGLPFCLVDDDRSLDRLVLVPAFWWTHNLYALLRNEGKLTLRDKRAIKIPRIEFSPFAPDTAEEMIAAIGLIELWSRGLEPGQDPDFIELPARGVENSDRQAVLKRPRRSVAAYREMLLWYAANAVLGTLEKVGEGKDGIAAAVASLDARGSAGRESSWENLGGQLVPSRKLEAVIDRARAGGMRDWSDMHAEYGALADDYPADKTDHAWGVLRLLYGHARVDPLRSALDDLTGVSRRVEEQVFATRAKDYENPFRRATFRNEAEMRAVVGLPEDNPFVKRTRKDMAALRERIAALIARL
jgi:hypothetical protein